MPQVQVIQPIQLQPKRLRVAAYARVSSDSEDQLNSLSVQVDYYTHLIQENPNWDFAGIYADEGITGTSTKHREQFNRLMDDCRAGLIDRVLVKSASRFARNTADALTAVRELKSLGVTVAFEKEGFDTETANGEMLLSMICAVAQEESLSISQNMKWGIRKRMQAGTYMNAMLPFGYDYNNHKIDLNPDNAKIILRIYQYYLNGKSIAEITAILNHDYPKGNGTWRPTTIQKMLANEKYAGNMRLQKTYMSDSLPLIKHKNCGQRSQYFVYGTHPPIVSEKAYEKIQHLLKQKSTKRNSPQNRPLSRMAYCSICGAVFSKKKAGEKFTWCCRNHLLDAGKCPTMPVAEQTIYTAFITMFNKLLVNREKIILLMLDDLTEIQRQQEESCQKVANANEEILLISKQLHNLTRIHALGVIEGEEYWEKRTLLEQQLAEKKAAQPQHQEGHEIALALNKTKQLYDILRIYHPLEEFDPLAFKRITTKISINNETIKFHLINGLTVSERRS